ncbi:hypothetical protein V6N13_073453 [Hibiscus sabdariffa]
MVSVEGNSSHSQGSSQRPQDPVEFVNGVKNFELLELLYLTKIPKKKERKFGSLSKIQDRFLSEAEKRKRDRIKKRLKKKEIEETVSELEGRLITNSDIEAMRDILLKEAINTLTVGKTVGIKFIADEQEQDGYGTWLPILEFFVFWVGGPICVVIFGFCQDLVVEIGWFFAMSLFLLEYVEWKQIDFAVSSGYESFNGVVCKEAVNPLHAHVFIVNDFKDWNGVNIRIEAFKI